MPCDVLALLATKCVACHSDPPSGGAPMPLTSFADLTAPSVTQPSQSVAQLCAARMQDTASPMPPAPNPPATAQDVAAMQAWVSAGTPQETCADAGSLEAGAVISPYDTPVQCSSGTNWTQGNDGQPTMHPGGSCIACHSTTGGEAPRYSFAGTVYPSAHEPDDCNGVNGTSIAATVVITDAAGKVLSVPVNRAGNFYSSGSVTMPFHAKVVSGGKERAMSAAQTSGDCNSCHTESGASSAPGRIMLP
jgi:hypothetical protein